MSEDVQALVNTVLNEGKETVIMMEGELGGIDTSALKEQVAALTA